MGRSGLEMVPVEDQSLLVSMECGVAAMCVCFRAGARDRASVGPYGCRDWSERVSRLARYGGRSVFVGVQERGGSCGDTLSYP